MLNHNQVWEDVQNLFSLSFNTDKKYIKGIDAIKKTWKKNKAWLEPFFDENGRRYIKVSKEDIVVSEKAVIDQLKRLEPMMVDLAAKEKYNTIVVSEDIYIFDFFELFAKSYKAEEIFNNSIEKKLFIGEKTFQKGTKVTKHFQAMLKSDTSHLLKDFFVINNDEEQKIVIEYIMTIISQLLSSLKKSDETVVLSINPLDILLASSHTHENWSSCHNIINGVYKTGPLSYMLDSVSAIAFAYKEFEDFNIYDKCMVKNYPKKLWRQMVFFDKENLSAIMSREYKREDVVYSKIARNIAAWILCEYSNAPHNWIVSRNSSHLEEAIDVSYCWAYEDAPNSVIRLKERGSYPYAEIGVDEIICPLCGDKRYNGNTGHHECESCNEKMYKYKKEIDVMWDLLY